MTTYVGEIPGKAGKTLARIERELPGDVWEKCPSCGEILYREKLKENWNVCPSCANHNRLPAADYVKLLLDDDIGNLVPCCQPCNRSKGTMTLEEWRS